MDEVGRRKAVIQAGKSDVERWLNPAQLEAAWEPRAVAAAALIPAGTRVADIGCGAMALERHLPFGCTYLPVDLVARDERTIVVDLNVDGLTPNALGNADIIVLLGVWEYLYKPSRLFTELAATRRPIVCSYCPLDLSPRQDRRALGWVNDLTLQQFIDLAAQYGYFPVVNLRFDNLQHLLKFERTPLPTVVAKKRVHVVSYLNAGNFGDRLGYHMLASVLPAHAEVSWGTIHPLSPPPPNLDLFIIGIGNSLASNLLSEQLIEATKSAKASIGIFGTQYRELLSRELMDKLLDQLDHWFARYHDDLRIYGGNRENVSHLGDWLINAFPMAVPTDDQPLAIGKEVLSDLPLDRTIQRIQRHRRVFSERLHPLLCALTSAEQVAYREQREMQPNNAPSGKFRSMLHDVFDRTFPENTIWPVDRRRVAAYKASVRANTDALRSHLAKLLG